ncbi:hypothetical protein [Amnibacterium setariae]|uniref:Uncharacterized protein n=1 Tax=Amnibacterium setariae TaxID=2306585 RepID=A0A3A1U013_9MICO|nr:hypothetical protein [Amnibacterium setariae]RIX28275.1 hypothetical protein D1781_12530 [Amnibacterium setariae]
MTGPVVPGEAVARLTARRSAARRAVHRRLRVIGAIALLGAGLYALACALLFVVPGGDPAPDEVDAVFVPAPVTAAKEAVALRMLAERRASAVLLSIPERAREWGTDENRHFRICRPDRGVYCEIAAEQHARSDARLIARLAGRQGWYRVLVVTDRSALLDARLVLGRCTPALETTVSTVDETPPGGWIPAFLRETGALLTDRTGACRPS